MMTENERVEDAFLRHDFRDPLTAIGVGLEMLKNDDLASRKKHDLYEQVRTAMEWMNGMMQELLDYSRGGIKLNFSRVQIGKFVEGIAGEFGLTVSGGLAPPFMS